MSNNFISPIDWPLSSATSLSLSEPASGGNGGIIRIPQRSIRLLNVIRCGEGVTPLQRCSRCILQLPQTGLSAKHFDLAIEKMVLT